MQWSEKRDPEPKDQCPAPSAAGTSHSQHKRANEHNHQGGINLVGVVTIDVCRAQCKAQGRGQAKHSNHVLQIGSFPQNAFREGPMPCACRKARIRGILDSPAHLAIGRGIVGSSRRHSESGTPEGSRRAIRDTSRRPSAAERFSRTQTSGPRSGQSRLQRGEQFLCAGREDGGF